MSTETSAVGEAPAEPAQEQAYVTMLYERLNMMRAALTRTTRRLGLVSYGEPPGGLPAALGRPSGQRMEGRL